MIPAIHPVGNGDIVSFYVPKHFNSYEVVSPEVFNSMEEWRIWLLFDPRILWTADMVRDLYDRPMTVNNWKNGGQFTLRGWRPGDINLVEGVKVDQHKYGRALDWDISGVPAADFVQDVINNPNQREFQFITALEIANWNHVDCGNYDKRANGGKPLTFQA
jgi:hypothetical protein